MVENQPTVHTPFWWPHEHLDELRATNASRTGKQDSFDNLCWLFQYGISYGIGDVIQALRQGRKSVERSAEIMRKINGEGTEVLVNKYLFIELTRVLGYAPLRQTLINTGESAQTCYAKIIAEFPDPEQVVFLKPLEGSSGRGIKIITVGGTERLLGDITRDFVVQEAIQIGREYRYAIFQDGEHSWRIAYEKTRPILQGDGQSTVKQLLNSQQIPKSTRIATMVMNKQRLNQVLPCGESIQMLQIGFPKKGNFEKMPGDIHKIENLDRFMARFIGDLEQSFGHKLPLLAFDIGVKDPSVLNGEYVFMTIQTNIIPFECQMPFTTFFYYKNVSKGLQTLVNFYNLMYRHPGLSTNKPK